jgi:transaldolase
MTATSKTPESLTSALAAAGVSIWLDDLSRERIVSGGLVELIAERNVTGVTTNPTIFATALSHGDTYEKQIRELSATTTSAEDVAFQIMTQDVRSAADILAPVHRATNGVDGWVSIEVGARSAHDASATIEEARRLKETIDRPNVFIKIPATAEGIEAIAAATAEGISVNITLIFSLDRYHQVIDAYLTGLEQAHANGIDVSSIHSVASFFVSRVDTEIDKRLDAVGSDTATSLRGRGGIANARLAYEIFEQEFATPRADALRDVGSNIQRPLWASTGVKDPALPDTTYVVELVAANVVNTMSEKTLQATHDHGVIRGDTIVGTYAEAKTTLEAIGSLGISYDDVTRTLEAEGVDKFIRSGQELIETIQNALEPSA